MQKSAKKFLALLLAASFICGPTAFAQTTPDASAPASSTDASTPATVVDTSATLPDITPPPADASVPIDASSTPAVAPVQSVNPQDPAPVQDTTTTQTAVTGDMLEGTSIWNRTGGKPPVEHWFKGQLKK